MKATARFSVLWREWRKVIIVSVARIAIFAVGDNYFPNTASPWYPNRLYTGAEIMAERHPNPDVNDPNFLADFRRYMGFDYDGSN